MPEEQFHTVCRFYVTGDEPYIPVEEFRANYQKYKKEAIKRLESSKTHVNDSSRKSREPLEL